MPPRTRGRGSTQRGRKGGSGRGQDATVPPGSQEGITRATPALHPLLTLQHEHRLKSLIDGEHANKLVVRHGYHMPSWDDRYEPYIRQARFWGVKKIIGGFKWDGNLICALVERWRSETHTFHLPVREMTITLHDVSVLLGLPIHGTTVSGVTDMSWGQVVSDYLGKVPEGRAMANKSALLLSWLRDNFSDLDENAPEEQVKQYARAYLLSLLGYVLLVDLTGDSVPCIYLPMLADFIQIRTYAWGAAVLGRLYRQLCHASGKNAKQMGGCLILLQKWSWERLPVFRPKILKREVLQGLTPETRPPRGFYWSGQHRWTENKKSLERYRQLIDYLQDGDVEWLPYTREILDELPPICMMNEMYWLSTAPLIDFATVETYHPDRVMRQFGRYQVIPPPDRSTLRLLHIVDRQKYPKKDWREFHKEYVDQWINRDQTILGEQRPFDPGCLAAYLQWYNAATIPTFAAYIGSSTDGGTARESLHRPEQRFNKMVQTVLKFAKKAARHMKRAMEPRFATEAFKVCREVVGTVGSISTFDRELADIGEDTTESEEEASQNEDEAENNEEEAANEEEVAANEVEAAENEEENEDADLGFTLNKIQSQITQETRPSPSKRPRRDCTNKYKRKK